MINRDRMSEIDWMQRLINLRNRLERDAWNVNELTWMMESKTDRRIADVTIQRHLNLVQKLILDAERQLDYAIHSHLDVAHKATKERFASEQEAAA